MTDTKRLNVAEMDFDQIKANLKSFMQSQSEFADYNFEGSAIGSLIDMMAYVTHYNAINANLGINETFLDTAQFRGSVVGHARQLGYTPRSATAPKAVVNVTYTAYDPATSPQQLPAKHKFKATISGVSYEFVTKETYNVDADEEGFVGVELYQGKWKTAEYVYSSTTNEKFLIPHRDADTSTLSVKVYANRNSSSYESFNEVKSITGVTRDSAVFFLSESADGRFQIDFGDGVIGKALEEGNLVEISYIVTDKEVANGAGSVSSGSTFSMIDALGSDAVTVSVVTSARGGAEAEDIRSIKFNAPLSYASQNRAVTPDDYRAIIRENFSNVDSIAIWGGEDNDPPQYGKVFISIKPQLGEVLSQTEKDEITNVILKPKAVVSIRPELVNPEYTYINLEVFFKYNPTETSLSNRALGEVVRAAIMEYNDTDLSKFDGIFRYSKILNVIDNADDSILNSFARVYMQKRFIPQVSTKQDIVLTFPGAMYDTFESVIYNCTNFTYGGRTARLLDRYDTATQTRVVDVVTGAGTSLRILTPGIGTIDEAAGTISLRNFIVEAFAGDYIGVTVLPNSNDIASKRNNLLTINPSFAITGDQDNVVVGKNFAGVGYKTVSRHA